MSTQNSTTRANPRRAAWVVLAVVLGRRHTTPIRVVEQPNGFIVPLTYGPRTSWYVNLGATPAQLHWQGRTISIGDPTLIPTSAVVDQFPLPSRFLLWLDGTDQCVRIQDLTTPAGHTTPER